MGFERTCEENSHLYRSKMEMTAERKIVTKKQDNSRQNVPTTPKDTNCQDGSPLPLGCLLSHLLFSGNKFLGLQRLYSNISNRISLCIERLVFIMFIVHMLMWYRLARVVELFGTLQVSEPNPVNLRSSFVITHLIIMIMFLPSKIGTFLSS